MEALIILLSIICANIIFHNFHIDFMIGFLLLSAFIWVYHYKKLWRKYLFLFVFFFIFSLIRCQQVENYFLRQYNNQLVTVEGTIVDTVRSADLTNYTLKTNRINEQKINIKIRIHNFENLKFKMGDRVRIVSRFEIPRENGNPYMFNNKVYLAKSQIFGEIFPKSTGTFLGKDHSLLLQVRKGITSTVENQLDHYFTKEHSNLLKTIFLGDKYISQDRQDQIRDLGISHIIAISGFHIGLIYMILETTFSWLDIHRKYARGIILLVIWAYTYAIGSPASCFRASMMITLLVFCKNFNLPWNTEHLLYLAGGIILFVRPYELYNVGFILSFAATYCLLKMKLPTTPTLRQTARATIIIYFFLLPIIVSTFNEITPAFIVGNLFIVPLFSIVITGGILFLFLPFKSLIAWGMQFLMHALDYVMLGSSHLFSKTLFIPSWSMDRILLYYLIFFLIYERRRLKLLTWSMKKCVFQLFLMFSIIPIAFFVIMQPVEIQFIDVGQGDSVMVRSNHQTLLFDTGGTRLPSKASERYISYLKKIGVVGIDAVFLTHFDEDHAGNLPKIYEVFPPFVTISRIGGEENLKDKYTLTSRYRGIAHGQKLYIGPICIEAFHYPAADENNMSVVYRLQAHQKSFLISGDIEQQTEDQLIKDPIQSNVLKVPHHGSKTSSSDAFLDRVKSRYSIISCGYQNSYGHPHSEVMERLKAHHQKIFRTDIDGNITFLIYRFGMDIRPHIGKLRVSDYLEEFICGIFSVFVIYDIIDKERKRINIGYHEIYQKYHID